MYLATFLLLLLTFVKVWTKEFTETSFQDISTTPVTTTQPLFSLSHAKDTSHGSGTDNSLANPAGTPGTDQTNSSPGDKRGSGEDLETANSSPRDKRDSGEDLETANSRGFGGGPGFGFGGRPGFGFGGRPGFGGRSGGILVGFGRGFYPPPPPPPLFYPSYYRRWYYR